LIGGRQPMVVSIVAEVEVWLLMSARLSRKNTETLA